MASQQGPHLGAGETEEAPDPCETSLIYPVHQGGGEATLLQEDQEEPPAGSTIIGDEGGPGWETTLSPDCPDIPEA